jgi:hypothetical protein
MAAKRHAVRSAGDLPPGIGAPATRALTAVGCRTLRDVATMREADVAALHGVGPKAMGLLRAALAAEGMSFKAKA